MKKIVFLCIIFLCLTGCFRDLYKNGKYAEEALDAWFNYNENEKDLGSTRRQLENISEIKEKTCNYVDYDKNRIYIYKCKITYTPIGETVIPLSKNETKTIYVALKFGIGTKYEYRVYNSKEKNKVWLRDDNLGYGK